MSVLSMLLRLIWWPFHAWKETLENSRVGVSEEERRTLRFWRRAAIAGTVVVLLIVGTVVGFLMWLMG